MLETGQDLSGVSSALLQRFSSASKPFQLSLVFAPPLSDPAWLQQSPWPPSSFIEREKEGGWGERGEEQKLN